jgi:hypothetical protein
MNSAKVVEREPARDSGPVVLPFLRKAIRQASEPANRQARESPIARARTQIAAFNNRSANSLRIGVADDWDSLRGDDFGRTINHAPTLSANLRLG